MSNSFKNAMINLLIQSLKNQKDEIRSLKELLKEKDKLLASIIKLNNKHIHHYKRSNQSDICVEHKKKIQNKLTIIPFCFSNHNHGKD